MAIHFRAILAVNAPQGHIKPILECRIVTTQIVPRRRPKSPLPTSSLADDTVPFDPPLGPSPHSIAKHISTPARLITCQLSPPRRLIPGTCQISLPQQNSTSHNSTPAQFRAMRCDSRRHHISVRCAARRHDRDGTYQFSWPAHITAQHFSPAYRPNAHHHTSRRRTDPSPHGPILVVMATHAGTNHLSSSLQCRSARFTTRRHSKSVHFMSRRRCNSYHHTSQLAVNSYPLASDRISQPAAGGRELSARPNSARPYFLSRGVMENV